VLYVLKINMIRLFAISTVCLFLLSTHLRGAEKEVHELWMNLSVKVQNLHYGLNRIPDDCAPSYEMHQSDLKSVEEALSTLTNAGELESKTVSIGEISEISEEKHELLNKWVIALGEKYGTYLASEMCDLGARHRFYKHDPSSPSGRPDIPIFLHIRLPKEDLESFLGFLRKNDYIEEGRVEPGGSGQSH